MAQLKANIHGYEVDLDTDMNGDGKTTGCWVSKGRYSASLACLEAEGVLSYDTDCTSDIKVDSRVIEAIVNWAERNGY